MVELITPLQPVLRDPLGNPLRYVDAQGSGWTGGTSFLQTAWSGIQGHFESTDSISNDGTSQNWVNLLVESYMQKGATDAVETSDPTSAGTVGTSDARFTFDGGDYFKGLDLPSSLAAASTTNTGQDFTFIYVTRFPASGVDRSFGNANVNGNTGVQFLMSPGGDLARMTMFNGTTSYNINLTVPDYSVFASGTDWVAQIIVLSPTRNQLTIYANSLTAVSNTAGVGASTTDATEPFGLHSNAPSYSVFSPNGTEMKTWAWGQGSPDSSERTALFNALETAHSEVYL